MIICQYRYCSLSIMNHVQKQKTCCNLLKSDFTNEILIIQIINDDCPLTFSLNNWNRYVCGSNNNI